ncbi:MAG: hypothetical protein QW666_01765 [Candidatus Woesearchaeota archaeon]
MKQVYFMLLIVLLVALSGIAINFDELTGQAFIRPAPGRHYTAFRVLQIKSQQGYTGSVLGPCELLGCPHQTRLVGKFSDKKYYKCTCAEVKGLTRRDLACFWNEQKALSMNYTPGNCSKEVARKGIITKALTKGETVPLIFS